MELSGHSPCLGKWESYLITVPKIDRFLARNNRRVLIESTKTNEASVAALFGLGRPEDMSFSIPSQQEPDIVLDMVAHALSGHNREEDADLLERVPAAFFKSSGLVAVAILLGGGLTGFTLPEADESERKWPGATMGGMVLAINVASVVPEEVFRAEADRYAKAVRETFAPLPGFDEALLPGAVEEQVAELHRREGIRFGDHEQGAARSLSTLLDVERSFSERVESKG
jgi:hypothetical protein